MKLSLKHTPLLRKPIKVQEQHVTSEPAILYLGTPVVLISTTNQDGSSNIAPMSSAFWLGWRCMLGLDASSKTAENMIRTGECVLNLPSSNEVGAVNRLARLTGTNPVPPHKLSRGYTHEQNKFEVAGLTQIGSHTVRPPRALECPVHLEAVVADKHGIMQDIEAARGAILVFEVRIQRVHVHPSILVDDQPNQIDPDKWRPLIMSFQQYYELAPSQVHRSRLGEIRESSYRSPDVDRARALTRVAND